MKNRYSDIAQLEVATKALANSFQKVAVSVNNMINSIKVSFETSRICIGFNNNKYCKKCEHKTQYEHWEVSIIPSDCPYYLEQVIDDEKHTDIKEQESR